MTPKTQKILLILLVVIFIVILVIGLMRGRSSGYNYSMLNKFNSSDPGLLISMLTLGEDSQGNPDPSTINVNKCIKLGSISKPEVNIMDLTLLNKKLPVNIFNANSVNTNFGIILNTEQMIPKDFPDKYIQCLSVRDSGSDLRRCDTDFDQKLKSSNHPHHTTGKYDNLPLRPNNSKCDCTYDDSISNVCNTKAAVAGCGAKCSESGKICGQVTWCDWDDFDKEPNQLGLGCATHPKDINQWIDATVAWNKARITQGWDVPHPENELDAYITPSATNQQMIIDSIECFVFTEMCGTKECSSDVQKGIQHYMEKATNDFNKFYNKNVPLYKLLIDTSINVGAYKNGKIISWEQNGFQSDLKSLLVPIKLDPNNITKPVSMYTYRVADTVDGIEGKNTGDIRGDNSYISGEFCPRHGDDFCKKSLITQYKVNYLPIDPVLVSKSKDGTTCLYSDRDDNSCITTQQGFGDYALCNPGGVVGGSVDKNGAYICTRCNDKTIPDYEEMCQQAPGVELDRFSGGKWFSWPNQTKCEDGVPLGTNGCNWNVEKNTTNFSLAELEKKGYQLLTSDKYKPLQSKCFDENGKLDKTCDSNNISKFVQKNANTNVSILNNAFRVPHIPIKQKSTMLSAPKTQGAPLKK